MVHRECGAGAELAEQQLTQAPPLVGVVACRDQLERQPAGHGGGPDRKPGDPLAAPVDGIGVLAEHALVQYTGASGRPGT